MSGPPNAPLLPPAQAARLLDDVVFTRVAELIDLPRLYDLEAMLALQIDNLGVDSDQARAMAKAMVDRALLRIARTSRKWTRWTPPQPPQPDDACNICVRPCDSQGQSENHDPPPDR